MKQQNLAKQAGFTLIELSIVLVIIGLIVGGVLVGQDLIKAAELRAAVGQIEKYDAAVNTFRGKYNGLPGDIANPATFGMDAVTTSFSGNGLVNRDGAATAVAADWWGEAAAFFDHMAAASLISENIVGSAYTADTDIDGITNYAPPSKLGRGLVVIVGEANALNHYVIGNMTVLNGALTFTAGTEMAVIDAFQFDTKVDDGIPSTGKALAVTDFATADAGNAGFANDVCYNNTPTPDAYNTDTRAHADDQECTLRIRTSF